jgi:hypothetical protein
MERLRVSQGPASDLLALDAERAGAALACAFSSSDEFDAAIIKARREAGAYGPSAGRKRIYWGCAAGVLVVLLLVLV